MVSSNIEDAADKEVFKKWCMGGGLYRDLHLSFSLFRLKLVEDSSTALVIISRKLIFIAEDCKLSGSRGGSTFFENSGCFLGLVARQSPGLHLKGAAIGRAMHPRHGVWKLN